MKSKYLICGLVIALIILHQDNWFWDDNRLIGGFMPVGLLYHAGISVAASLTWFLAIRFAWPSNISEPGLSEPGLSEPGLSEPGPSETESSSSQGDSA